MFILQLRTTDTAAKICEAEKNHVIAGLEAKISELEVHNEELLTARLLNESKVGKQHNSGKLD